MNAYQGRQHERVVDRWWDCADTIPIPPRRSFGTPERSRRREEYRERVDEKCGGRP